MEKEDRKVMVFELDEEEGVYSETSRSVKSRVAHETGFAFGKIELLEADYDRVSMMGRVYSYCRAVDFSVLGRGYWTDFAAVERSTAYDSAEGGE